MKDVDEKEDRKVNFGISLMQTKMNTVKFILVLIINLTLLIISSIIVQNGPSTSNPYGIKTNHLTL